MMRRFLVPAFALLLAVGGCAADSTEDASSSEDELRRAVIIGDADDSKTFTVEQGKDVQLFLSGNPTAGYQWKVVSTSRSFGYPSPRDGTFQAPGGGSPVGAGGRYFFRWKTDGLKVSARAQTVKLEYRRPFEGDDVPAKKTFKFKIKVKAGNAAPPPEPAEPIVLFEEHNNDTIRAKEGQDVVLRLPENPSTGYRWYVTSVDRTLGQPEKDFEGSETTRPGAGGTGVFTWKTTGALSMVGSHSIALKRSRGESGDAEETFKFKLEITAAVEDDPFECPPESRRTINCMPPVRSSNVEYCKSDYQAWAKTNCDVDFTH